LLVVGIRETATTNNIANVLKLGALAVFVVAGATLVHPDRWFAFAPHGWGSLEPFSGGVGLGIIPAAAFVFFNYVGFDSATVVAEECIDPQRDLPLGIVGTLGIATLAYCAVAVVLVGAVPWQSVDETNALARAIEPLHNAFVNGAIIIGIVAGTVTVAISAVLGQTRIFYVMARDRMLPSALARVNPRLRTPVRMTMSVGVFVAVLTLIVPLDNLVNIVNLGALFTYVAVCIGVMYLRRKYPDVPRAFRCPFVPLFPLLGIASCVLLAVFGLDRTTWLWFLGSMLVGLCFFFLYGFRHANPDLITTED
jgi:basic amino acid/polyamine antiporter, APA family